MGLNSCGLYILIFFTAFGHLHRLDWFRVSVVIRILINIHISYSDLVRQLIISLEFKLNIVPRLKMTLETVALAECGIAFGANKRLFFSVPSQMKLQSFTLRECSVAKVTFVGPSNKLINKVYLFIHPQWLTSLRYECTCVAWDYQIGWILCCISGKRTPCTHRVTGCVESNWCVLKRPLRIWCIWNSNKHEFQG